MSGFFESRFPTVRAMLEQDRDAQNAREQALTDRPWKLMGLNLGEPEILSSHRTEADALAQQLIVQSTCAPFIRNTFWIEQR